MAVARSVAATIVSMLFFGWLLLLAAAVEAGAAFWVGHWAGFFQHALAAILFGVVGLMFLAEAEGLGGSADLPDGGVLPRQRHCSRSSAPAWA